MELYPSHRFHPTMKEDQFFTVVDAGQDSKLKASDAAWRDSPYTEEESAAYLVKRPGAKRPINLPGPSPKVAAAEPITLESLAAGLASVSSRLEKLESGSVGVVPAA